VGGINYAAIAKAGGLGKGKTRKQRKARKDRADDRAKAAARVAVFARDLHGCRARRDAYFAPGAETWQVMGACAGPLTLAHLLKRSATRNQAPEVRHNPADCVALCQRHHMMEEGKDRPRLVWAYMTDERADGLIAWSIAR
jgi:hypothetical protein